MSSIDGEQVVDALLIYNKDLCHVLYEALTCASVIIEEVLAVLFIAN